MRLVTEWFGTFLLAQDRLADQILFPRDADAIAARLDAATRGEILAEEAELATRAGASFDVEEDRLAKLPGARRVPPTPRASANRAEAFGFPATLLHDASILHAKHGVQAALSRPDAHVVLAVDALDDLTEAANLLSERLREWYGIHYPEAASRVERHEELAGLIAAHGRREAVHAARPDLPADSFGGPLDAPEEGAMRGFARLTSSVYATRAEVERYLDERLPQIAPNLTILVGGPIAARLLKLAGGLARLAKMPAGTIQTLGAEKALFRHLKEGKKPPKHGVLLQHPIMHRARRNERGALARALAARVALAARADYFTKQPLGEKLLKDFEARAAVVRSVRSKPGFGSRNKGPRGPPVRRDHR